jgi:hypothetical protein
MVKKYTNIYHSKARQNLPKFGIFGLKTNHLATLMESERFFCFVTFCSTVEFGGAECRFSTGRVAKCPAISADSF